MAYFIATQPAEYEDREGVITTRPAGVRVEGFHDDVVNGKMIVTFVDEVAAIPLSDLIAI